MSSDAVVEVIGYVASGLIIVSLTQKSILRLRIIGLVGSLTFLVYALLIQAYPIAVVNTIAASIHVWYLRQLLGNKDEVFRVLHVLPESRYLLDFLTHYRDEIQGTYQPDFDYRPDPRQVRAFILRDMVPAGLFIGHEHRDGTFEVELDFVIPQYRDFKIGRYVYSADSGLLDGIEPSCVWSTASTTEHAHYLRRMGFRERDDQPGRFEFPLAA